MHRLTLFHFLDAAIRLIVEISSLHPSTDSTLCPKYLLYHVRLLHNAAAARQAQQQRRRCNRSIDLLSSFDAALSFFVSSSPPTQKRNEQ